MTERTDYKTMASEIAGDVEAIRKLYVENHELRRTRSEAEAAAEVRGHKAGIEEGERRLRALLNTPEIERLRADKDVVRSQARNAAYEADIKQLRAALSALLAHDFADECQECGIGKSTAWTDAKVLVSAPEQGEKNKPIIRAGYYTIGDT